MAGDTATVAVPTSRTALTLDEFLDSRSAGFDLVRLVLAFLVLVSHTFPLEQINEAFIEADQGRVTRAAIVP